MGIKLRMVVSARFVVRGLLALTLACLVLGAPAAAQFWGDPPR
jgi:hypothetical protein